MSLETGTFVNDLVTANPIGATDKRSQGDDHLRLIKSVLRNTFPLATTAFYFPRAVSKVANYTVIGTDNEAMIYVDASAGPVTISLTAAATLGGRFRFAIVKSDATANAVTIDPNGAETINGLATLVLNRTYEMVDVFCTGSVFTAARANGFRWVLQTWTAGATYTPTVGLTYALLCAVGAGGGGGGAASAGAGNQGTGGGGGGASASLAMKTASQIGASQVVTIPAGPAGGAIGNNPGTSGGDASIGGLVIGKGGTGGSGAPAAGSGAGGAGGVAGTGDILIPGMPGSTGNSAAIVTIGSRSGRGGNSGLGFGAGGTEQSALASGNPGQLYGGGGGGGYSLNSGAGAVGGGAGAGGLAFALEAVNI